MYSKLLGLSVVTALMATSAFAEPQVQPGESLESLSKVKVSTSVNGQAASLQELVASGKIRILDTSQNTPASMQAGTETQMQDQSMESAAPPAMDTAMPDQRQATLESAQDAEVNAAPEQPMTDTVEN